MVANSLHNTSPSGLEVLADPVRWDLLRALAKGDLRVQELTSLTGRSQNLVSYHLKSLRDSGLVDARRSNADRRDTYYRARLDRCGQLLTDAAFALHPGVELAIPPAAPETKKPTRTHPTRVLFLCTGNSSRSQIAEALLEHRSFGCIEALSAGTQPKPLHPMAIQVMTERGIDIAMKRSKHLRRYNRTRFDHVITLCDRVREVCPPFPHHPVTAHWSVPDPSANDATHADFEHVVSDLDARIGYLIAAIAAPVPAT